MATCFDRITSAFAVNVVDLRVFLIIKEAVTWNDARGIHPNNPNCDCGISSRQDRVGVWKPRAGMGFWTCASGACSYYSELSNGQTPEEAANYRVDERVTFRPWLW
jgi:hypothetical protein